MAAGILVAVTLAPPHKLLLSGDTTALTRITFDPFDEFNPKVAPNGSVILYDLRAPEKHDEDGDEALMTIAPDGGFRGTEMTHESVHAVRPDWLPDGSGFVFIARNEGTPYTLYRVDSRQPFAPMTPIVSAYQIGVPNVSPDGRSVTYAVREKKGAGWFVWVASLDPRAKSTKKLYPGFNPVFSPDGQKIAFTATLANVEQIQIGNTDGTGKASQLTIDGCDHEDPVFAPDGTRLVYVAHCGKTTHAWNLYAIHLDGTHQQQLTTGDTYIETPVWFRDEIYFAADVAGNFDVWRLNLVGDLAGHARPPSQPHKS